ncbi:MAG: RNA methyltransferase [Clostridia bacterium]|nr:RNA methyltransferase [Clostridia bacterium]
MDYISSRNNPLVSKYAKLSDKKARDSEKLFLIEGAKLFEEAVESGILIEAVLFCEGKDNLVAKETLKKLETSPLYNNTRLICLAEGAFLKISTEKSPDGVICVAKHLDNFNFYNKIERNDAERFSTDKVMLLCSVRDPGNIGTIARSAVAFGFDRLVISSDCADPYNSRAMRASMGAFFKINVDFVKEFETVPAALVNAGRKVYCAELREGARSLDEMKIYKQDCFMVGNEGHGIPKEVSKLCSASVYIPIAENSESLNAAIAASQLAFVQI